MKPVLTRDQARELDALWIERGVPGLLLMENAGRGAASRLIADFLAVDVHARRVVVLCGPGNNGGDGFVVARRLVTLGVRVSVCAICEPEALAGDARANYLAFCALGEDVHRDVRFEPDDIIVDAMFGTGLVRALSGDALRMVEASRGHTVVALDIPSGLDADTGAVLGAAMRAKYTYTFGALKPGLVVDRALEYVGKVSVIDIGVPAPTVGDKASLDREDLPALVSARSASGHKYDHGHVLVLGGSKGTEGAAELSARGALRTGAGLVTRASLGDAGQGIPEVMRVALPRGSDVARALADLFPKKRAIVVGPGLGRDVDAEAVIACVLSSFEGPIVFDADALRLLEPGKLAFRPAVLTPHTGELAHLLGVTPASVDADRFGALRDAVSALQAVVVLKGARTLIGAPDGRVRVCLAGTPALATAGSGDVLSGVIGALSCSLPPFEAAVAGVLLHALAGESWTGEHGDRGLLASEIADRIPRMLGVPLPA